MRREEFASSAPAPAAIGRERLERSGLVMPGTLRRDSSPRVTRIAYFLWEGELTLSGMWQSMQLLDLLRGPRCAVHSTTTGREGLDGGFKLHGRALHIDAEPMRERRGATLLAATGWRPSGPFHLSRLDITVPGFVQFGEQADRLTARLREDAMTAVRTFAADPNTVPDVVAHGARATSRRRLVRGGGPLARLHVARQVESV